MRIYERVASTVIGTPLQWPAEQLRALAALPRRLKHPELREIYRESRLLPRVVERVVEPDMNCIDVGAHLGSVLARIVRAAPRGHHIAVEPVPYKADWLRRKFPTVDVRELALGESDARAEFFLNSRRSGFSGLRQHGSGDTTRLEVACARLDEIVPADRRVGFIKIDVEGGELGVFRGAQQVLSRSRPTILFECTR